MDDDEQEQQQRRRRQLNEDNHEQQEHEHMTASTAVSVFNDAVLVTHLLQQQQHQDDEMITSSTTAALFVTSTETETETNVEAAASSGETATASSSAAPRSLAWSASLAGSAENLEPKLPTYEEAVPRKTNPRRIFGRLPDEYLNVLVAGEAGLGKSTFIRTLFMMDTEVADLCDAPIEPTREISPVTVAIPLNKLGDKDQEGTFHLQWVDTPGYGDSLNIENDSIKPVVKYLHDMYMETGKNFADSADDNLLRKILENNNSFKKQIDLCFFFIPAHRIKEIDLKFMKILSEHVPIVPLIAKADTMTVQELREFRQLVRQKIDEHDISIFDLNIEDNLKPPFVVISSRTLINVKGSSQKLAAREYPWGTCMVENPQHSDVSIIRRLLLYSHLQKVHQKSADMFIYRRHRLKRDAEEARERERRAKAEERKKPLTVNWKAASILLGALYVILVAIFVLYIPQPAPVIINNSTMDPFQSYIVGLPSRLPWPSTISAQTPFVCTFDLYAFCAGKPCPKDAISSDQIRVFMSSYGEQVQSNVIVTEDTYVAGVFHVASSLDAIPSGSLRISVWMGHSQIKDSPFELPLPQQRRVEISGPGVLPIYEADAEKLTISCELRLLEQASSGMKSTLIMPDVSSPVPVKAWMSTKNDKGEIMKQSLNVDPKTWTITFKPPTTPEHTIEIRDTVSGEHVQGSPFNVHRKARGIFFG